MPMYRFHGRPRTHSIGQEDQGNSCTALRCEQHGQCERDVRMRFHRTAERSRVLDVQSEGAVALDPMCDPASSPFAAVFNGTTESRDFVDEVANVVKRPVP
jgi:hypothetical protein